MTAWWDDAACRGHDPELWFPVGNAAPDLALVICAGCPVRAACLADADRIEDAPSAVYGIRGGLTASERLARYQARRRAAQPSRARRAPPPPRPQAVQEAAEQARTG